MSSTTKVYVWFSRRVCRHTDSNQVSFVLLGLHHLDPPGSECTYPFFQVQGAAAGFRARGDRLTQASRLTRSLFDFEDPAVPVSVAGATERARSEMQMPTSPIHPMTGRRSPTMATARMAATAGSARVSVVAVLGMMRARP